jgi:hypothetical protein
MKRGTLAAPALCALLALYGCGDDGPAAPGAPTGNNPSPTPGPTASPSPTPTPSAPPGPEPSPSNKPPTVSVSSSGSCHPLPARPCTVSFNALVSDPDGDPIRFGWDGCAHGNQPLAICTIAAPGPVTASVLVDDGNGGLARGSASAVGTNAAPRVHVGRVFPNPAPSNTTFSIIGQQPDDPDGDEDPNRLCTRASLAVSGPCRASLFACGGVADGFDIDVRTLQGPGTCVIEGRVADLWGAVGTDRISFAVAP